MSAVNFQKLYSINLIKYIIFNKFNNNISEANSEQKLDDAK